MKRWKKGLAALLATLLLISCTGCSTDKSWVVKTDATTISVGAYIYDLYLAYQEATYLAEDLSKSVLEQQIEDQDAETWIKNRALSYTKAILLLDQKMQELGLELTEDDISDIEDTVNSDWSSMGPTLESWGISKDSYRIAGPEFNKKFGMVFRATYGENGPKAVSNEELKEYFETNYTDFNYIIRPLYTVETVTNADGEAESSVVEMKDSEMDAARKEFDDYVTQIQSGDMTIEEAAKSYQETSGLTEDPLQSSVVNFNETSGYPEEFTAALAEMTGGEVKALQLTMTDGEAYVLLQKNDITEKTEEYINGEDSRPTLLASMKYEEFFDGILSESAELPNVTQNDAAVNSYSPSMFEK